MVSTYLQTSLTIGHCNSERVSTPWKRLRTMNVLRTGCDIPNESSKNPRFNSLKACNAQSSLLSTHNADVFEKPLSQHRSLSKKHSYSAATPEHETAAILEDDHSISFQSGLMKKLDVIQRFCRPFAIVGTAIGASSISLLPLETISELTPNFLIGVLMALIPVAIMDIYMNGINELFDVEIDKVNKPYLPLASGEMSMKTGASIVAITSSLGIGMALMMGSPPLLGVVLSFFFLGGAYSVDLPFLRWKNNAFLAASCFTYMKAPAFQFGIFMHIQKYVLKKPIAFTRSLVFATAFMSLFSAALMIIKDIPDVDGDKAFGVKSLAVLMGKETAFRVSTFMIMLAYGVAIMTGVSSTFMFNKLITVLGHTVLASLFWLSSRSIDLSDEKATYSFFRMAGKLYFVEYLLIPFVR